MAMLDVFQPVAASDGRELIVDNFAGGGGASEGIFRALRRHPDVAINHDADALSMHEMNHPETRHISKNIWQVDPLDAIEGRPVGLAWFSPDCKHFSKAKGGKPVKREIRDLAWVVVSWAKRVKPRVIILENVEEFQTWGPLLDGLPCPERKGETFELWKAQLKKLGYRLEHRELRACDYGAPTVRKRLFLIARRDKKPIVWPKPTHGPPDSPEVLSGKLLPYRTAADIIDWSLPCPSIFMTKEDARAYYAATGIRVNRPLADATMARIARGVWRFVIDAQRPFIVPVTHQGDLRVNSIDEPLRTQTTANRGEHALVTPFLARTAHGDVDSKGKRRGKGEHSLQEPIGAVTQSPDHALVAPLLVPRYGERPGQDPRCRDITEPFPTVVGTGNEASLVAAHISRMNTGAIGNSMDEPLATVTSHQSPTGRHGGAAPLSVVAAFLAQHNTMPNGGIHAGHSVENPVSTLTAAGTNQTLMAAHLMNMRGTDRDGHPADGPLPTFTSGGNHLAEVRAFLIKYHRDGGQFGSPADPLASVTTRDRVGIVMVHGHPYQIVDIGMRMLTPRERFRAQGFGDNYIIDRKPDGTPITATKQGSCAGNSVSPNMAEALVRANCSDLEAEERVAA